MAIKNKTKVSLQIIFYERFFLMVGHQKRGKNSWLTLYFLMSLGFGDERVVEVGDPGSCPYHRD